jgi:hypothetical protein
MAYIIVIASEARQSSNVTKLSLDCRVATRLAMTGWGSPE